LKIQNKRVIINRFAVNIFSNSMNSKKDRHFSKNLLLWDSQLNKRLMPWKGEKDPYKIWLSEIILQQTRVDQGMEYYKRYIKKYPTIKKLAAAPETEVFKLWEGLGYYSRCKNLIATARFIADELDGKFPDTYGSILKLKGIGPYTAAAIASFAYNLPYAVVDGNVMRVLARYFGISTAIDSSAGKEYFSSLANRLLAKNEPALYNQAIMDFGATVCKPQLPLCSQCVLKKECTAYQENAIEKYPVKENKLVKKERWFYYVVVSYRNAYVVKKRTGKDIWQNLHEFILIEENKQVDIKKILSGNAFKKIAGENHELVSISKKYKQQLTHQTIQGYFIHIRSGKKIVAEGYELMGKSEMSQLAFPKFITTWFEDEKGIF